VRLTVIGCSGSVPGTRIGCELLPGPGHARRADVLARARSGKRRLRAAAESPDRSRRRRGGPHPPARRPLPGHDRAVRRPQVRTGGPCALLPVHGPSATAQRWPRRTGLRRIRLDGPVLVLVLGAGGCGVDRAVPRAGGARGAPGGGLRRARGARATQHRLLRRHSSEPSPRRAGCRGHDLLLCEARSRRRQPPDLQRPAPSRGARRDARCRPAGRHPILRGRTGSRCCRRRARSSARSSWRWLERRTGPERPRRVLVHEVEIDGRAPDQLRPVRIHAVARPLPTDRCSVEFGRTRVLCAASVTRGCRAGQGLRAGWVTASTPCCPLHAHSLGPRVGARQARAAAPTRSPG
jgi:hypothetical protein